MIGARTYTDNDHCQKQDRVTVGASHQDHADRQEYESDAHQIYPRATSISKVAEGGLQHARKSKTQERQYARLRESQSERLPQ